MSSVIDISIYNLLIGVLFIVIAGAISVVYSLKLEKDLLIGSIRTVVQLFAMGYLLKFIFGSNSIALVMTMFTAMTLFAAQIVHSRVKKQNVAYFLPTLISVLITFFLITYTVTNFIIGTTPWWSPQYFITIGGMVAGNSMNALAISLERLFSDLKNKRSEVEMMLCHGATVQEANKEIFSSSLRAGMIPSINAMMGAGLVSIPGMMTGQILAGTDPSVALRYQIVVMLMITASTALASFLVLKLVSNRCFGKGDNLLV